MPLWRLRRACLVNGIWKLYKIWSMISSWVCEPQKQGGQWYKCRSVWEACAPGELMGKGQGRKMSQAWHAMNLDLLLCVFGGTAYVLDKYFHTDECNPMFKFFSLTCRSVPETASLIWDTVFYQAVTDWPDKIVLCNLFRINITNHKVTSKPAAHMNIVDLLPKFMQLKLIWLGQATKLTLCRP